MRALRTYMLFVTGVLIAYTSSAQYFLRGEVNDEKGIGLQNVKIVLQSSGISYSSGIGGAFGIPHSKRLDSLRFSLEGYETVTIGVDAGKFLSAVLKMQQHTANRQRHPLLSISGNLDKKERRKLAAGDETYNALMENQFLETTRYPLTSLILNVDRASYSNIRRFINMNSPVPPDGVRIEEMLNYFNFNYTDPPPDSLFAFSSYRTSSPWARGKQLLYLQLNTRRVNISEVPPTNLVFLIDVSGSMDMPNRLPLLQSSFRKLVENLRPIDTLSIVVYGGVTGVMLPPTGGDQKEKIYRAIEELTPGGNTPGEAGILQAYKLAQNQYIKGGNNRVILATDGDFNVGQRNEEQLEQLISRMKQTGIYLTCLGVGMGNYKDSKIEVLARKGNGNFAYIDNEQEGEKVLVKELTQTLFTAADDVYMNVRFQPEKVARYRLIGFDNKRGAFTDTTRSIEGGEIGSGHSVMAIFEIEPRDTLNPINNIAQVSVHYKLPQTQQSKNSLYTCKERMEPFATALPRYRFAASIGLFGMLLRQSEQVKNVSWNDVIQMAQNAADLTDPIQKEYVDLLLKAQKIYAPQRKKLF